MKSLIVLLADGFEEIEFVAPVDILRRLGLQVTVAGVESLSVKGAHDVVMQADMLLADAQLADYDGIVLPGGQASWFLRDSAAVLDAVRAMDAAGKLLAAICAAPLALEAAGVLSGRQICCYPADAVTADITSVAEILKSTTVRDGHIITGKGPGAALDFGFAIGEYFLEKAQVDAMRAEMCTL